MMTEKPNLLGNNVLLKRFNKVFSHPSRHKKCSQWRSKWNHNICGNIKPKM